MGIFPVFEKFQLSRAGRPLHENFLRASRGGGCGDSLLFHEHVDLHRGADGFSHEGADPHRRSVRVRNLRIFPFWEYDSMVATFLLLQRRMESSKGRSCRPVEKEPVGWAGCRSVCNSLRGSSEKESNRATCRRNSTNCKTRQPAPPPAVFQKPHRLFF